MPRREIEKRNIRNIQRSHGSYYKDNFGKLADASSKDFRSGFTPEVEERYRAWVKQKLQHIMKNRPADGIYSDSVEGVLADHPAGILQRIIALKEGRIVDIKDLLAVPFSEVVKKYLNMDLPKDYFKHFRTRSS